MNPYIYAENLTKEFKTFEKKPGLIGSLKNIFYRQYQSKKAVHHFNMQVNQGEIIGLLGPNGAGKTTLMKMFTGIIVPTEGELIIANHCPFERERAFRKKIALVMGQKSQLWWDIPAMDSFLLLKAYYEIDDKTFKDKLQMMAKLLDVEKLLHIHVRRLSLGERMKMELMASLLHNPEVLFLDEPTIGLDLLAQENIRHFIKRYHRENNVTIFLTSHYMADVHALCERIILIQQGQKTYDGSIGSFEKILGNKKKIHFQFSSPINSTQRTAFDDWQPQWSNDFSKVDIHLSEEILAEVCSWIIQEYKPQHFSTEKMPIENVMKTLLLKASQDQGKSQDVN